MNEKLAAASEETSGERTRVPIIDRMMDLLEAIADNPRGASIRELTEGLRLPRTTVYRVLNTLQGRGVVRRGSAGVYVLGPKLEELAAKAVDGSRSALLDIVKPHLVALTNKLAEASKISILDGGGVLVLATARAPHEYGLTILSGNRLPLYAGAASKLLLANMPPDEIARVLAKPRKAFTNRTIVDADRLRAELQTIREQGWSEDSGEYSVLVCAYAAPVVDLTGNVIAAVSVPFLDDKPPAERVKVHDAVLATAKAISIELARSSPISL